MGFQNCRLYRQTNRQTDTTEIIYHAASRVVNKMREKNLVSVIDLTSCSSHYGGKNTQVWGAASSLTIIGMGQVIIRNNQAYIGHRQA